MSFDITDTLAPTSDQLDAVDLAGGPRIFTVAEVSKGSSVEQPLNVRLAEFPRVWRPSKNVRRILAACWGTDAQKWTGNAVELFCDPTVKFGGKEVGGIRISRISGIDKPQRVVQMVTRGKGSVVEVQPLPKNATPTPEPLDFAAMLAAATTKDECSAIWKQAGEAGQLSDDLKTAITARVEQLDAPTDPEPADGFLPVEGDQ